jgi:hypothetical protein
MKNHLVFKVSEITGTSGPLIFILFYFQITGTGGSFILQYFKEPEPEPPNIVCTIHTPLKKQAKMLCKENRGKICCVKEDARQSARTRE